MKFEAIRTFLLNSFSGAHQMEYFTVSVLVGIAVLMVASYYLCEVILMLVSKLVEKTETDWDDDLLNTRFLKALSQLAPALVLNWLLPEFFFRETDPIHWIKLVTSLYILVTVVYIICVFVGNLYDAMARRESTRLYAVKGIFDMIRLVVVAIGIIIGISMIIGKSPMVIITALGASAAVLMLVFKDTLMGLVAGVQLTVNRMLHAGDWIIAEKHGINGEVEEVSLTTVKVRNWDQSVSTIPPYALITDSFKNYQPMRDGGGRRVERSVFIDMDTVRFLDETEISRLHAKGWLEGINIKKAEKIVNLGLFRYYLEHWLSEHPDVRHDMLYMVRQMPPTESGLPLNIYFFLKQTAWKDFEHKQSDVFDHIYAVVHEFGLGFFQTPTGHISPAREIPAHKIPISK